MSLYKVESRELKSLKRYFLINELKNTLKKKVKYEVFASSEALHPKDRIFLRMQIKNNNLSLRWVSKSLIKSLFTSTVMFKAEWRWFSNLCKGGLLWIRLSLLEKKTSLGKNSIKMLLNLDLFKIRFFIYNNILYRAKAFYLYIEFLDNVQKNNMVWKLGSRLLHIEISKHFNEIK